MPANVALLGSNNKAEDYRHCGMYLAINKLNQEDIQNRYHS